jgi:hypothetical protein
MNFNLNDVVNNIVTNYQNNPNSLINGTLGVGNTTPVVATDMLNQFNEIYASQVLNKSQPQPPSQPSQQQQAIENFNKLKEDYQIRFDEIFIETRQLNDNYNTMYINTRNSFDLYLDLFKKNKKLREQFNSTASTIFTNDRKSVYENQGLKTIQMYGKILFIFHIILILFFIFAIFYFKNNLSIYWKVFYIILLILQPLISRIIMFLLNKLFTFVKQFLPKNVYLTL